MTQEKLYPLKDKKHIEYTKMSGKVRSSNENIIFSNIYMSGNRNTVTFRNDNLWIRNPRTQRLITIGGTVYKRLIEEGYPFPVKFIKSRSNKGYVAGGNAFKRFIKDGYTIRGNNLVREIRTTHLETALRGSAKTYTITSVHIRADVQSRLNRTSVVEKRIINDEYKRTNGVKFQRIIVVRFQKTEDAENTADVHFMSKTKTVIDSSDLKQLMIESQEEIVDTFGQWIRNGSGWSILEILHQYLNMIEYRPLQGSSYVELPLKLRNSMKGLVNVKNMKDDECFRWCHLAYKFPAKKDPQRISKYRDHIDELNYVGIKFPVTTRQIPSIEKQNNISISVFGYNRGKESFPYPIYVSKEKFEDHLDLLLVDDKHYVWIKEFNRFMRIQPSA